jgi:phage shock protein PspC (stress-responsive transcriptional regulator)
MFFLKPIFLWFEVQAFGVCQFLGSRLGIRATKIRMYFIYLSFFTAGSPIIIYFFLAFLIENRNRFKLNHMSRNSVWDI